MKFFNSLSNHNYLYLIPIWLISLNIQAIEGDSILHIPSQKIYVDNIGNIYAVQNDVITKYFVNQQVKTFSIKTYGTLAYVDVTNALRILLYFKDFQRILFLDSQLSQNGDVIELTDLGLEQCALVCTSMFNNGFWAYNQANNELIRFNSSLEISIKSGNLKRILDMDIRPNFMLEHNGRLYLNSPNIGILVFDIYGAYLKTIPLLNVSQFQVQYPYIFYIQNNQYASFNVQTFEQINIDSLQSPCTQIIYNGNYCYRQCLDTIQITRCVQ